MSRTVDYRPKTGDIPTGPGVYRFRDGRGRVLYVGKAKNLRARLSNYFQPLTSLHERTRKMVTTATSVEWTVVRSEFEALQLEFSWIKEFDPPFNVQFRDDKSYPYLVITLGEKVPRVFVTRQRGIKDARYFGPYTKAWAIRETVDHMLKAFPMRSCTDAIYRRAEQSGRPCLLGDIGKCAAPCVGRISYADHKAIALDFASFMAGNDARHLGELATRMQEASEAQDYELAATLRDRIAALESVLVKNSVVLPDTVDADLFGIVDDELSAAVQLFTVRGGRIRGTRAWVVDKELDISRAELVESILFGAYEDGDETPPRLVVVPELPSDTSALEQWLSARRTAGGGRGRVELRAARRGDLAALAETVTRNAAITLSGYKNKRSADFTARSQALSDLQEALSLQEAPLRIECFDVSHLAGTNIVASMVVFEDGLPRKDQYRRFSIAEAADDTDALRQVLRRRLTHLDEAGPDDTPADTVGEANSAPKPGRFSYRPNLLLVDGGQPQVAAAASVLAELGIVDIALSGIAKRLEELWLPGEPFPVILPRGSDALFLVQRLRDEAHRFAIGYQRQRRKRDIASVLGEIPGLGPVRVRELLRHFGSVTRLRAAGPDDIAEVKGIGPALAATVHAALAAPHPSPSQDGTPAG